jgi:hypothetical protein
VFRTLPWCVALSLFTVTLQADQTVTSNETVVRLAVQPMRAPQPALRYLLLPDLKEMNPGNPIPNYLKCMMDVDPATGKEIFGRATLRQADWAARLDKPDWQILLKVKTDGFGLLLPDVQKIRSLAAALQQRFREEIALSRFDDALVTAKTMFSMSRHMSEHPTLIGDLVGIAIAAVAIAPLEEMLEQPGCPNLYWALTNLPNPLISIEGGLQGERALTRSELGDLDEIAPMNADRIKKLIVHIDKLREMDSSANDGKRTTRAWIAQRIDDPANMLAARVRLVEVGFSEDLLKRFPAEQVVLLDEKREYEVRRDEVMKLIRLPLWQMEAQLAAQKPPPEPALFDLFLPGLNKVRRAQGRLEQRIALLRHVEALRMHAAAHEGQWPEKLTDIAVPLPDDPFTGKAFRYRVDSGVAHVRGSPPPGEEMNPGFNVRYELTIRK